MMRWRAQVSEPGFVGLTDFSDAFIMMIFNFFISRIFPVL
jgi:hypothetical protein